MYLTNLTRPQQLVYDMEQFAGGSISVLCGSIVIKRPVDLSALMEATNELFRINDALRIRIVDGETGTQQYVEKFSKQNFEVLSFNDEDELDSYADAYAKVPLDLYGNLCEARIVCLPNVKGLIFKMHHIISDAWTFSLLGRQLNDILNKTAQEMGGGYRPSYLEYVEWENTYLYSPRHEKDKDYFLVQFEKCNDITCLSDRADHSFSANRKSYLLSGELTKEIYRFSKQHNASPFLLFLTALAAYVYRVKANTKKFYLGTAVLNRTGVREKNTAGMFINTVPVLIELDDQQPFSDNMKSVQTAFFSVLRHQKFNYGDVLSAIRDKHGNIDRLYDTLLSYQNATFAGEETSLKNDLCLNSFDLIQMVAVIEEEFDIEIADCRIKDIKTVGDVIDIIERSN